MKKKTAESWLPVALGGWLLLTAGCAVVEDGTEATTAAQATERKEGPAPAVDVSFLLSMTHEEARRMSAAHLEMRPYCRIAADAITVLKQTPEGTPLRVRAVGRVFVEIEGYEKTVALGQEAYVERGGEIMVRGRPLLKRGQSVVEGMSDDTTFSIRGARLQVMGRHRAPALLPEEKPVMLAAATSSRPGGRSLPSWDVTPSWGKAWQDGPNPLLPALSPEDVPESMRATPLLPMPEQDGMPRLLGEPLSGETVEARKLGRRVGGEREVRLQ